MEMYYSIHPPTGEFLLHAPKVFVACLSSGTKEITVDFDPENLRVYDEAVSYNFEDFDAAIESGLIQVIERPDKEVRKITDLCFSGNIKGAERLIGNIISEIRYEHLELAGESDYEDCENQE